MLKADAAPTWHGTPPDPGYERHTVFSREAAELALLIWPDAMVEHHELPWRHWMIGPRAEVWYVHVPVSPGKRPMPPTIPELTML